MTLKPRAGSAFRLLLVDDHQVVLESLALLLEQQEGWIVCGQAGDAHQAMRLLCQQTPDMAIIDVVLPDRSGIELTRDMLAVRPDLQVLCLSALDEMRYAKMALQAGARGYVEKKDGAKTLLQAIQVIRKGGIHVSSDVSVACLKNMVGKKNSAHLVEDPLEQLTAREFDVLQRVAQGKSTREIAEELRLSPNTIQRHKANIKDKFQIQSSVHLIQQAMEWFEDWLRA